MEAIMRSQIRFFMNADDERRFVKTILEEPDTFLINGPHWASSSVPLVTSAYLAGADHYLMIWNQAIVPRLQSKQVADYWEAYNASTTIQFLRCRLWDKAVLTEGRLTIATEIVGVIREYHRVQKLIRQTYQNGVVCWVNRNAPESTKHAAKPDASIWVGPGAMEWLRSNKQHQFKQSRNASSEAVLHAGIVSERV